MVIFCFWTNFTITFTLLDSTFMTVWPKETPSPLFVDVNKFYQATSAIRSSRKMAQEYLYNDYNNNLMIKRSYIFVRSPFVEDTHTTTRKLRNTPTNVPALLKGSPPTKTLAHHFFFKMNFSSKPFFWGEKFISILLEYFSSSTVENSTSMKIYQMDEYYETSLKRVIACIRFLTRCLDFRVKK